MPAPRLPVPNTSRYITADRFMNQHCDHCRCLWRSYAAATADYFSAESKLLAAERDGIPGVALLARETEALEKAKVDAANAIRQHEKETGHR
jgi:hypothetical protein